MRPHVLATVICLFLIASAARAQEVGFQLYSFRHQMAQGVAPVLDSLQAWGVHAVEGGNQDTYGLPLAEYRAMLAARDIEIVSVSATYEELRDAPETIVAKARKYDARYVVCFWIPHADTLLRLDEARLAIEDFNRAGQVLAKAGIRLMYHPHGYEFGVMYEGETLLDLMVKESEHFDFEMDVYWFEHPGQDPVAWLRRYPQEFGLMHLKDCRQGVPHGLPHDADVETNVTLGTGQFKIAEVVREARRLGIPYLFVEDESSRSMSQGRASVAYVREVLRQSAD